MMIIRAFEFLLFTPALAYGWGGSSSSSGIDYADYADSFSRDWLNDGSSISLVLEGCIWGNVNDAEEAGCLEESSEDGTSSWYMMSNCRRAQAAFSLYASGSSQNCNSGNFKESFVTTVGLSEFIGWLQDWDTYSPFSNDDGNDDGYGGWDIDELPLCEQGNNGGYVGLGCNSDGTFSINTFSDQYCLSSTGIYDTLSQLNYKLKTYKNCRGLDSLDGGGDDDGNQNSGDGDSDLSKTLIYYAQSCSNVDSSLCKDDSTMEARRSDTGRWRSGRGSSSSKAHKSWTTKVKYGMGGILLVSSLVMFTGILFTNRRRRKALMQRKFRQSSSRRSGSKSQRSSRSGSKAARSRSSKRSKSRPRESTKDKDDGGVYT